MRSAVKMYLLCADCETEDGFKGNFIKEAALCMRDTDSQEFTALAKQAIQLFTMAGRMSQACSLAKSVAEKMEEDYNYEAAREFYEQAAQLYEMDNQQHYANQMLAKWADLSILIEDFAQIAKIIKTYDKVGKKYL